MRARHRRSTRIWSTTWCRRSLTSRTITSPIDLPDSAANPTGAKGIGESPLSRPRRPLPTPSTTRSASGSADAAQLARRRLLDGIQLSRESQPTGTALAVSQRADYVRVMRLEQCAGAWTRPHGADERLALLAGGTDLLTLMKADVVTPTCSWISSAHRGCRTASSADRRRPGARRADDARRDRAPPASFGERYPALAEAVALRPRRRNCATWRRSAATCSSARAAGTSGSPLFHCWLKGGDDCPARDGENQHHALFGESPCVAIHPSDPARR